MINLQKILSDIANLQFQEDDLAKMFDEVAVNLLRQVKIVTPKDRFYLREIEIYFFAEKGHPDPYTHKNKRQLEFGEWYFHRYKDIEAFLNSNRNGVDITFGNKSDCFGGLLIRKIQNVRTGDMIVGINRVARILIENIGKENADEIALGIGGKAFDKSQILHLEDCNDNCSTPIYKTQRNGLTFYDDELSQKYFKIPYCYYNHNLNIPQIIEVKPGI